MNEQLWNDERIINELTRDPNAFKCVVVVRDEMQARIAELEAQLVAAQGWEPLPDGRYVRDSIIDGRIEMRISDGGESIAIVGPDEMWESISLSPFEFRLARFRCRTQPQPAAGE